MNQNKRTKNGRKGEEIPPVIIVRDTLSGYWCAACTGCWSCRRKGCVSVMYWRNSEWQDASPQLTWRIAVRNGLLCTVPQPWGAGPEVGYGLDDDLKGVAKTYALAEDLTYGLGAGE